MGVGLPRAARRARPLLPSFLSSLSGSRASHAPSICWRSTRLTALAAVGRHARRPAAPRPPPGVHPHPPSLLHPGRTRLADLLLLDPWNPCLRYFPASAAADGSPVPLPTLALPDGTAVAVASSLEGLAAEQAAAAAAAAAGGAVAAAAAVAGDGDEFVPGPDYGLEELRLMEVDVRTFAQGADVGQAQARAAAEAAG